MSSPSASSQSRPACAAWAAKVSRRALLSAPAHSPSADRRPIDPPPIVQLRVVNPNDPQTSSRPGSPGSAQSYLQNPYYFMFASLASVDTDDELHLLKDGKVGLSPVRHHVRCC
jgi:hypothetical protein